MGSDLPESLECLRRCSGESLKVSLRNYNLLVSAVEWRLLSLHDWIAWGPSALSQTYGSQSLPVSPYLRLIREEPDKLTS